MSLVEQGFLKHFKNNILIFKNSISCYFMYSVWNFKIALSLFRIFLWRSQWLTVLINFASSRLIEELTCMSLLEICIPAILYHCGSIIQNILRKWKHSKVTLSKMQGQGIHNNHIHLNTSKLENVVCFMIKKNVSLFIIHLFS